VCACVFVCVFAFKRLGLCVSMCTQRVSLSLSLSLSVSVSQSHSLHFPHTLTLSLSRDAQASATGRSAKTVLEFLEKAYSEEIAADEKQCIRLAVRALLEVVQSGSKNIEVAFLRHNAPLQVSNIVRL
jgi:hypothetical protein